MLLSTVTSWLASLLAASLHDPSRLTHAPPSSHAKKRPAPLQFELRHLHAVSPDARVVFSDVHSADVRALAAATGDPTSYVLRPQRVRAHRPSSQDAFQRARVRSMRFGESELVDWDKVEVEGPDVGDRETLLELAKMTNNAYLSPGEQGWYDLGDNWTVVSFFVLCFAYAVYRMWRREVRFEDARGNRVV